MTTDQPTTDGVAPLMVKADLEHPEAGYTGGEAQPTPTSSLEEAREAVINAALLPFTPAGEPLRAYVTERVDRLVAAARAEVIREVEAVFEKYGAPDHGDWCSSIQAWNPRNRICDCGRDDALRVLSQGGEG